MPVHRFPADAAPFLPLTEGIFEFALNDGGVVDRCELNEISLGMLAVPSGKLVVCDPFLTLQPDNNATVDVPVGRHEAIITLANVGSLHRPMDPREAYLSLIVDPEGLAQRRRWQGQRWEQGLSPAVPLESLAFLHLQHLGEDLPQDLGPEDFIGVNVETVTVAMVDAESVRQGMPEETPETSWYATFFQAGVPGSWFDLLDNPRHVRTNAATVVLPKVWATPMGPANLVMCHSGWGVGVYPVVGEYRFNPDSPSLCDRTQLVAVHINLNVVPCAVSPVLNH